MITIEEATQRLNKAKEEQKNSYPVIVDGNFHRLGVAIRTKKEQISMTKCRELVAKLEENFNIEIDKIEISMIEWDYEGLTPKDFLSVLYGDAGIAMNINKKALFFSKSNCLQIFEDNMPVYENRNGEICRDADALADCLL